MSNSTAARLQVEREPVAKIEDLVTTPAHARPRGIQERNAQSVLRKRRIKFIKAIMHGGNWGHAEAQRVAEAWYPTMDDKHRLAKVRELSAIAWEQIAPEFDRTQVASNILARTEALQRHFLFSRPDIALKAMDEQAKIAGIVTTGGQQNVFAPTVQQSIVVQQENGTVSDPSIAAMFRGIGPRVLPPAEALDATPAPLPVVARRTG